MPLEHYEIETDGLYLEGLEKGIKIGIEMSREKGLAEFVRNFIVRMLQFGGVSNEKIAFVVDVDIAYVNEIEKMLSSGTLEKPD